MTTSRAMGFGEARFGDGVQKLTRIARYRELMQGERFGLQERSAIGGQRSFKGQLERRSASAAAEGKPSAAIYDVRTHALRDGPRKLSTRTPEETVQVKNAKIWTKKWRRPPTQLWKVPLDVEMSRASTLFRRDCDLLRTAGAFHHGVIHVMLIGIPP